MATLKDNSKEYVFKRMEKTMLGMNVFEAAMERIGIIHDLFDHIFISYSGGKDSELCLKLFELYRLHHGITEKLNVVFYDEELVDSYVLEHCKRHMDSGRYNFRWLVMPLESEKYVLGQKEKYIQWDENREHIRPIPKWAEVYSGVRYQDQVYKEYTRGLKGRIAIVLGLRAAESINRYRAMFATKNTYPFMNNPERNCTVVKPVYDWSEKDVFKFFYDFGVQYCNTYDHQIFNGDRLRVSTPLHAEAARTALLNLKTKDPVLYDQIMSIFPEIELQVRYFKEHKTKAMDFSSYEKSWRGVIKFARDVVAPEMQDEVVGKIMYCKKYRMEHADDRPLGGYPLLYMFETIAKGTYKRMIAAMHNNDVKQKHYDFEADSVE